MTNTASLALTNAHGAFRIDTRILDRAIAATTYRSLNLLRRQAAAHCGYGDFEIDAPNPLDDCSRIEVLIIWIESGNHTF